jgi:hypothetical protein
MRGLDPRIHLKKMNLAKWDGLPDQVRQWRRLFLKKNHSRRHFFFF